jgi:signal transduction histidine kinase
LLAFAKRAESPSDEDLVNRDKDEPHEEHEIRVSVPVVLAVLSPVGLLRVTQQSSASLPAHGRRAHALLQSVETSGRSALEELRRLLGLLSEPNGDAPLAPQPGVTEIPTLVEQVQRAGLPVELCVQGQPRVIAGGVAVAAYRIVQEALTNVLKHAGGASTSVVVRWAGSWLELEILDRGVPQHSDQPEVRVGRGLAGMRERATMYGGTLDAHPEPGGGYLVRARLPLEPEGT